MKERKKKRKPGSRERAQINVFIEIKDGSVIGAYSNRWNQVNVYTIDYDQIPETDEEYDEMRYVKRKLRRDILNDEIRQVFFS